MKSLAVLSYHKIGEPQPGGWLSWYYISQKTLADQLRYLREHGWVFLSGDDFLRGLRQPDTLPERASLITFDDAYRSLLTQARPVLEEFACPSVVFLPTAFAGGGNDWDQGCEPYEPIVSWEEAKEMERAGMQVEAHSVHHPAFSKLSPAQILTELQDGKQAIESQLKKNVRMFAFPYGDASQDRDQTWAAVVASGYEVAFLYGGGAFDPEAPRPHFYPRLAMGPDSDLAAMLVQPAPI